LGLGLVAYHCGQNPTSFTADGDRTVVPAASVLDAQQPTPDPVTQMDELIWWQDPDALPAALDAGTLAAWHAFQREYPGVDPTELEPLAKTLHQERQRYPLHLSPHDRETYAAWLARTETMARALVVARAEALGIAVDGTATDGREFVLHGFHNGTPFHLFAENSDAAISTAASFVRRNAAFDAEFGPEVDGSGFFANVNDTKVVDFHPEFRDDADTGWRVGWRRGAEVGNHATHVAGTIAARGVEPPATGMAPGTFIHSFTSTRSNDVYNFGMDWPGRPGRSVVGNSSLGTFNENLNGVYTSNTALFDQAHFDTPYYLHFYAAGNSGPDYFSLSTPHKDGKNLFAVGSVRDVIRNEHGAFVSGGETANSTNRGPTRDGRIKPDIVANGIGLYSPQMDGTYKSTSGTSMASPNAAGSAILLQDYFNKRLGGIMRASTLMALIINTAEDLGIPGPDYTHGWGLLNALEAATTIRTYADDPVSRILVEDRLTEGGVVLTPYHADGSGPVRATLVWTDLPGPPRTSNTVTAPALVNNLNLRLIGPGGVAHLPFVMPYVSGTDALPPFSEALLEAPATTGINHTDNKLQVLVADPAPGTYLLEVSHSGSLAGGFQLFSLAVTGMRATAPLPPPAVTMHNVSDVGIGDLLLFELSGSNFLLGSQVILSRDGTDPVPLGPPMLTDSTMCIRVDPALLAPGTWQLAVRNPDGQLALSPQPFLIGDEPFVNWATACGLSGARALPAADPDGDGIPNQFEFLLGFDPTDANSRLKASLAVDGLGHTLTINRVVPNGTYTIESTPGLNAPWEVLQILDVSHAADDFTVVLAPEALSRYYRVRFTAP